jgi:hypothetical protein
MVQSYEADLTDVIGPQDGTLQRMNRLRLLGHEEKLAFDFVVNG